MKKSSRIFSKKGVSFIFFTLFTSITIWLITVAGIKWHKWITFNVPSEERAVIEVIRAGQAPFKFNDFQHARLIVGTTTFEEITQVNPTGDILTGYAIYDTIKQPPQAYTIYLAPVHGGFIIARKNITPLTMEQARHPFLQWDTYYDGQTGEVVYQPRESFPILYLVPVTLLALTFAFSYAFTIIRLYEDAKPLATTS